MSTVSAFGSPFRSDDLRHGILDPSVIPKSHREIDCVERAICVIVWQAALRDAPIPPCSALTSLRTLRLQKSSTMSAEPDKNGEPGLSKGMVSCFD